MKSVLLQVFSNLVDGKEVQIEWHDFVTLGIVLASKGYPEEYEKGAEIKGADQVDALVYHMGTAEKEGKLVTAGGRVMIVVGKGATLKEAQTNALRECEKIECDNLFHRTDIGHKAMQHQ